MSKRREGREAAIQFLFQADLNKTPAAELTTGFWSMRETERASSAPAKVRDFANELIAGVLEHRVAIDERIKSCLVNFDLERLAAVDRNVLRVAIYELLFSHEVAPVIIINEAIEVAKKYGTEKSGGFVNGVLDRIKNELGRPARVGLKNHHHKPKPAAPAPPPAAPEAPNH